MRTLLTICVLLLPSWASARELNVSAQGFPQVPAPTAIGWDLSAPDGRSVSLLIPATVNRFGQQQRFVQMDAVNALSYGQDWAAWRDLTALPITLTSIMQFGGQSIASPPVVIPADFHLSDVALDVIYWDYRDRTVLAGVSGVIAEPTIIPEPSSLLLLLLGIIACSISRH